MQVGRAEESAGEWMWRAWECAWKMVVLKSQLVWKIVASLDKWNEMKWNQTHGRSGNRAREREREIKSMKYAQRKTN